MATRRDVIEMAHRLIGVVAQDEAMTADNEAFGGSVLDALFAELSAAQGMTVGWTLDTTPAAAFMGLSQALGSDLAAHYGVPYQSRAVGIGRLRANLLPDDRPDSRDLDGDLTVTTAEEEAAAEGQYF